MQDYLDPSKIAMDSLCIIIPSAFILLLSGNYLQVVPQMNVGDSYECSVPCASSGSFFPPISSITQNLSSAKSEIDLLQVIAVVNCVTISALQIGMLVTCWKGATYWRDSPAGNRCSTGNCERSSEGGGRGVRGKWIK